MYTLNSAILWSIYIYIGFLPFTHTAVMRFHDAEAVPQRCSKTGIFKSFTKLTGKHPCQNLFFSKVAGLTSTA